MKNTETVAVAKKAEEARQNETVWRLLKAAEEQYREYRSLTEMQFPSPQRAAETDTKYSWSHPLGIVIRS